MKLYFLQKKYIVLIITIIPLLVLEAQSNKEKAVNIANKVLEAMGGVKNYNNTKFIQWNFAKRTLYWNKWNGDVRIENPEKNLVILINVNNVS